MRMRITEEHIKRLANDAAEAGDAHVVMQCRRVLETGSHGAWAEVRALIETLYGEPSAYDSGADI
jgi:hypothetical protein